MEPTSRSARTAHALAGARFDSGTDPMSLEATRPTEVSATVSLWVPRGEAGNLQDGVEDVLANVDGVETATVHEVTDVRPTWTDIRVTADVDLAVASENAPDESQLRATVRDGFGVTGVEAFDPHTE